MGNRTRAGRPPAQGADRIYESIHAAVLDHRLVPGTRLREEELAEAFGLSRTLVRQALHRLAQDGVVVLQPHRGAQVPVPTREEGAHVFDARRVVECEVVRRLAGRLSQTQLATLEALVHAEAQAAEQGNQREAIRLSGAFHLELARCCGNPRFVRMVEELLPTSSLLIAMYKAPGAPMCGAHDHQSLLARLRSGTGALAAAEMRRHLTEIERSLAQPGKPAAPALRALFQAEPPST